jgi:multicomponent Na+:H+ antiporter subunit F
MLLGVAILGVLAGMAMIVIRGIVGPTIFDRILAANMFGTNVIVLIVLLGHIKGTEYFIDVALTYGLVNFITTLALLRYFKYERAEE